MKNGHWYVADVSNFPGNPVHRIMCECVNSEHQLVKVRSYSDQTIKSKNSFYSFSLVEEVESMQPSCSK